MGSSDSIALPAVEWKREFLEDTELRRLVLEHYDQDAVPILRYVLFLGVDSETGQDIVQESFLKLHKHLLSGGERQNLRAWLYRVAHNLARSSQISFRANRATPLSQGTDNGDLKATDISPEERLLADERLRQLRNGLTQLSSAQRECLLLRTQGLKYREIAEILNLSISTVGENIQRGLEKLKEVV